MVCFIVWGHFFPLEMVIYFVGSPWLLQSFGILSLHIPHFISFHPRACAALFWSQIMAASSCPIFDSKEALQNWDLRHEKGPRYSMNSPCPLDLQDHNLLFACMCTKWQPQGLHFFAMVRLKNQRVWYLNRVSCLVAHPTPVISGLTLLLPFITGVQPTKCVSLYISGMNLGGPYGQENDPSCNPNVPWPKASHEKPCTGLLVGGFNFNHLEKY